MKIVIAPDSFKNCLPADMVANYLFRGISAQISTEMVDLFPISDGGEGFCRYITQACNGSFHEIATKDPYLRPILSQYGEISPQTAVMDIAGAAGLELLSKQERNPLLTSSFGVGLMIKKIIECGYKKLIIGLGGSSTNDCGIGLARAIGYRFLDSRGKEIELNGKGLGNVAKIDESFVHEKLKLCRIEAACDVSNELLGKNGASMVYARQKGATKDEVKLLEKNMSVFKAKMVEKFGIQCHLEPGAGAAGGIGFAIRTLLHGKLFSGIDLFLEKTGLQTNLQQYDYIISGEGELNEQTFHGKAICGIDKLAKRYNIPLIVVVGSTKIKTANHFLRIYELEKYASGKEESIKNADKILIKIGNEIGKFLKNQPKEEK